MSQVEELCYRAVRMDLQRDFYSAYPDGGAELALAAQLGNALLLENRQLKEERNQLQQQFTHKTEELEQGRHELRLKLDGCQTLWESQVSELEQDIRSLNVHVERLTLALDNKDKELSQREKQHNEISQQLQEQLQAAMEVEKTISAELLNLKEQLRERGHPRPEDEELLGAFREQVARLTQREQTLAQQFKTVCQENAELRDSVSTLSTQLSLQEQRYHSQTLELAEAWQEVETVKARAHELQSEMQQLQEEVSLQQNGNTSLFSEMNQSLSATNWSQDKEQVTEEVRSILEMLLPKLPDTAACSHDNDLEKMLGQLKTFAEQFMHCQDMKQPIVKDGSGPCENKAWIQELCDQNAQLSQENAELKAHSKMNEEIVQRAVKDRDNAIAKKTAVEAELMRSKNDMMCLNNQLLEAIQRKLELSQELEAWQDDIQIIINQQLKSQTEQQSHSKHSAGGRLSFLRKSWKITTSSSHTPEASSVHNHSPWRDWLKKGK